MTVGFWITLWFWVLVVTTGVFALLAVAVSIGGLFDIRALFRTIDARHREAEGDDGEVAKTELR